MGASGNLRTLVGSERGLEAAVGGAGVSDVVVAVVREALVGAAGVVGDKAALGQLRPGHGGWAGSEVGPVHSRVRVVPALAARAVFQTGDRDQTLEGMGSITIIAIFQIKC